MTREFPKNKNSQSVPRPPHTFPIRLIFGGGRQKLDRFYIASWLNYFFKNVFEIKWCIPSCHIEIWYSIFAQQYLNHVILLIIIIFFFNIAALLKDIYLVLRVSGQPNSAQESTKMRILHQRGRTTMIFFLLSSSCLCLMGWGSSSLEILKVC